MCWVDCGPGRHDSDRLLPLKFYRISFDDVILISRKKKKKSEFKDCCRQAAGSFSDVRKARTHESVKETHKSN